MLLALIANNQNVSAIAERPPTIHVDRGGGGPLWSTRYDIIDIVAAASTFPEISGEDPVARAVRRTKWIGEALPHVKEAREKRDAAVFMAGAQLADAAARAEPRTFTLAEIEQLVQIIDDERRSSTVPVQPKRGGAMVALGLGLVLGGIAIGVAISRRQQPRRR